MTAMTPTGIIVHHSLTKDGKVCDWDGIKRYHMSWRHNGEIITLEAFEKLKKAGASGLEVPWSDIGYHGGIERQNGKLTVMTGRPINQTGGHCKGRNDALGFCFIGNFDLAPPDDEMLKQGSFMIRAWLRMYPHLTSSDVHMHREYADYKSCPGKLFPWDRFMALVEAGA